MAVLKFKPIFTFRNDFCAPVGQNDGPFAIQSKDSTIKRVQNGFKIAGLRLCAPGLLVDSHSPLQMWQQGSENHAFPLVEGLQVFWAHTGKISRRLVVDGNLDAEAIVHAKRKEVVVAELALLELRIGHCQVAKADSAGGEDGIAPFRKYIDRSVVLAVGHQILHRHAGHAGESRHSGVGKTGTQEDMFAWTDSAIRPSTTGQSAASSAAS